jgi:hypothetical protein
MTSGRVLKGYRVKVTERKTGRVDWVGDDELYHDRASSWLAKSRSEAMLTAKGWDGDRYTVSVVPVYRKPNAAEERAAIVRWMKKEFPLWHYCIEAIAGQIERGEHWK